MNRSRMLRAERLLLSSLWFRLALLDVFLRGARFYVERPRALIYVLVTAALAAAVDGLRLRPLGRGVVAVAVGLCVTAQLAFYRYFHAPFDEQAAVAARVAWIDVRPLVVHAAPALVASTVGVAALEFVRLTRAAALPYMARTRTLRFLPVGAVAAGLALGGPLRDGTAELRTTRAAAAFFSQAGPNLARAEHRALPPMVSQRDEVPSILFIITESVRASSFCGDERAPCEASPKLAALLPDRVPLLNLRAVASYTAVSLSVLLTGQPQTGARASLATAPDLFDYVRATSTRAGRATMHYWSAQKSNFFERSDPRRAVDSFLDAEQLLGHPIEDVEEAVASGLDRRLADECARRVGEIASPFVAVVHFSGTHAPYFFDEATAPHRPFARVVTWSGLKDLERSYQNAILEQDESAARCVQAFLTSQGSRPHVIVYTSDHGESFGEHAAIHHGQNLYDEQIRVPGFVHVGGGALRAEEVAVLRRSRLAFVTHFDLLPTVLDVLGILDNVALRVAGAPALVGRSLLRAAPPEEVLVPVTNCTEAWPCPLNTWGVLGGGLKLTAQAWDGGWRCMDLRGEEGKEGKEGEEGEEKEVPIGACAALVQASHHMFRHRPNGDPND